MLDLVREDGKEAGVSAKTNSGRCDGAGLGGLGASAGSKQGEGDPECAVERSGRGRDWHHESLLEQGSASSMVPAPEGVSARTRALEWGAPPRERKHPRLPRGAARRRTRRS